MISTGNKIYTGFAAKVSTSATLVFNFNASVISFQLRSCNYLPLALDTHSPGLHKSDQHEHQSPRTQNLPHQHIILPLPALCFAPQRCRRDQGSTTLLCCLQEKPSEIVKRYPDEKNFLLLPEQIDVTFTRWGTSASAILEVFNFGNNISPCNAVPIALTCSIDSHPSARRT